nr:IRK-interacting protein [Ipomoea batatas]
MAHFQLFLLAHSKGSWEQWIHEALQLDSAQGADNLCVSRELKRTLSELKHFYSEHNPKPVLLPLRTPDSILKFKAGPKLVRRHMGDGEEIPSRDSE